jgi:hypothetical protein
VEIQLKYKDKISRRSSQSMIMDMVRYSIYPYDIGHGTDADIKRLIAQKGNDFNAVVEHCRTFTNIVPNLENMASSTVTVSSSPGAPPFTVHFGESVAEITGPTEMVTHVYRGHFESAIKARDKAVQEHSFIQYQQAIVLGVSSIEAYLKRHILKWNEQNPDKMLIDDVQHKVPFDDKITDWIPLLTNGKIFDKSTFVWNDFITLRTIRDDAAIHSKTPGFSIQYTDLAILINKFRSGIAEFLFQLHLLFNEKVHDPIIRARYAPDVEVFYKEP